MGKKISHSRSREINSENLEKINEMRRLNGLPPLKETIRKCSYCSRDFISDGPHNRRCNTCKNNHRNLDNEELFNVGC